MSSDIRLLSRGFRGRWLGGDVSRWHSHNEATTWNGEEKYWRDGRVGGDGRQRSRRVVKLMRRGSRFRRGVAIFEAFMKVAGSYIFEVGKFLG